MAKDKVKRVLSEAREQEIANYHLAKIMIKTFGVRPWMLSPSVCGENGERIIGRAR